MIFRSKTQNFLVIGVLLLFVSSALVGLWATYDPSLGWSVLTAILISLSIFWIIASSLISPWSASRALVIVAGLFAFYFIFQYRHFDYQQETGLVPAIGRLTSSFSPNMVVFTPHPNAVASFLEGVLLVSLVVIGRAGGRARWIWIMFSFFIAYGLFISESRGAWLGIAIAMGIWILLIFRERALQLLALGVGISAGLVGGIFFVTRLAPGQNVPLLTPTLSTAYSRLTLYQNSLRLMKDYPFTGIGLGDTFGMVYSRYQLYIHVPFLSYAHNLFLSVSLGQGLLGLIALVGLMILFYYFVIRVERAGGIDSEARLMLFRAAWLGVTASLIHGLTDSAQFSNAVWTMPALFVLAGIAVAVGRRALISASEGIPARVIYVMGVIVVILLFGAVVFWQPLTGAWYVNLGSTYQTKADLSPSLDESTRELLLAQATENFEQALNIDPDQSTANQRLGLIALEHQDFETAVIYLERAYTREPHNQGTLKTLGYAYLWTGQLDAAEQLFRQVDFNGNLADEMDYWYWWWGTQDQENLSSYAQDMAQRLRHG